MSRCCSPPAGGDDAGLTRAEVEEIVRAEVAGLPDEAQSASNDGSAAMPAPVPAAGLTRAEVETIVGAAIAGLPDEAQSASNDASAAMPAPRTRGGPDPRRGRGHRRGRHRRHTFQVRPSRVHPIRR